MSADNSVDDPIAADPFSDESDEEEEKKETAAKSSRRNWFLFWTSLAVVLIIVPLSVIYGDEFFGTSTTGAQAAGAAPAQSYLIPYLTCLAGVLLFIMGTARSKGDDWDLGRYRGEHACRVAQAFAYLFVVWWAWSKLSAGGELQGTYIRPNILGFLVGFFILRVERAMDGLGGKFEEMLFAILPRAARYTVVEERKRQQVRAGVQADRHRHAVGGPVHAAWKRRSDRSLRGPAQDGHRAGGRIRSREGTARRGRGRSLAQATQGRSRRDSDSCGRVGRISGAVPARRS